MKTRNLARGRRLLASVAAMSLVFSLASCAKQEQEEEKTPILGYANTGVTVASDKNSLQEAVDKMNEEAKKSGFSLEYKGTATSQDGTNFSCYIANSTSNEEDLYIQIFADAELTDELFLSGLIRPGQAFESVTLNRPLEQGTHTVYIVHTKVTEDLTSIHSQITVTAQFVVS